MTKNPQLAYHTKKLHFFIFSFANIKNITNINIQFLVFFLWILVFLLRANNDTQPCPRADKVGWKGLARGNWSLERLLRSTFGLIS
jgi:hypothetical protein